MELRVVTTKDRLEVRLNKTVLASLVIEEFCNDKDETVEESIIRACLALQNQLKQSVRECDIDENVEVVVQYISDCVRPKKRITSGYRKMSSPYMRT